MKQAVKKKTFKPIDPKAIRAAIGIKQSMTSAEKEMEFIVMPPAFENALKLPGIPQGYMTIVTGWSNTGKSTLKNCLIAACQKQGIYPVIYETENNFDWKYAQDCGVEVTPIYGDVVDEETGEIVQKVVDYDGFLAYFDTDNLIKAYGNRDYSTGKETSAKRDVAVIEDIAYSINDILDKQAAGDIPCPICFIWDSVGSISSYKTAVTSKVGNPMFDAGALSTAFTSIINSRIPSSRKVDREYTNTFFCVNKIWNDAMNSMGGAASIELKGGKSFYYAARLIIHLGGIAKASSKALLATTKGSKYQFGITTKVKVTKNQLPTPYNVTYEGTFDCVHNGIIPESELEQYKKTYMKDILARLSEQSAKELQEADIKFTEEEVADE